MAKKPLKVGDRAVHDDGRHGVVLNVEQCRAEMHWGSIARTVNVDGKPVQQEHRYTEWVPKAQLTLAPQPVGPDEIAERQKAAVMAEVVTH